MKRFWVKRAVIIGTAALVMSGMAFGFRQTSHSAYAAEGTTGVCSDYNGQNEDKQDYYNWSKPIESYLVDCKDRFMRLYATSSDYSNGIDGKRYVAEYYDKNYNLLESREIALELPIFGGFYESGDYYYIVSGQRNEEEDDEREVIRVTKYDKNWNRVAFVGINDINTTVPFEAGNCRITDCGDYLVIRTSHEMYKDKNDGYNHQADMTIEIDKNAMKVTDSLTDVFNKSVGYVSHSFNQFIKSENNKLVAVDHGDAWPRSFILTLYRKDCSDGRFLEREEYINSNGETKYWYGTACDTYNFVTFPGGIGNNYTGASVGGFEITDTSYMIAGNIVNEFEGGYSTRNIFISTINKDTKAVEMRKLTNLKDGEGYAKTPHLIKISEGRYMVLWTMRDNDKVFYTEVDGSGNSKSPIYSFNGHLSDCVPIVSDEKIIWYVRKKWKTTFYEIDTRDYSNASVVREYQHEPVLESIEGETAVIRCSRCGSVCREGAVKNFKLEWHTSDEDGNRWSDICGTTQLVGATYVFEGVSNVSNCKFTVSVSDNEIAQIEPSDSDFYGCILFKKPGKCTITFTPVSNSSLAVSYDFEVIDKLELAKELIVVKGTYKIVESNAKDPNFFVWNLSDHSIAGFYLPGVMVIGENVGEATITVYSKQRPEVRAQCRLRVVNPVKISNPVTVYDGIDYSLVYDPQYYAMTNPDVYEELGGDGNALLWHFVNYGMAEGRKACEDFNVLEYAYCLLNDDLRAAFGGDMRQYYLHYINQGKAEGRSVSDWDSIFDAEYYLEANPDVKAYLIDRYTSDGNLLGWCLWHYCEFGAFEGRLANAQFSVLNYAAANADVFRYYSTYNPDGSITTDFKAIAVQYLQFGNPEGRPIIGKYNMNELPTLRPDVVEALGIANLSGWCDWYVNFGQYE